MKGGEWGKLWRERIRLQQQGWKKSKEISAQQTHCFTLLRGLPHLLLPLHHHISQLFHHQHMAQPFTLYCLGFSSLFATTTQQFLLEKRSSLAPGSCFHSKTLVFTLWAHRPQHLHVLEQSHQPCASPRGTVPKGRAGRELGSVLQKLRHIHARAVISLAQYATKKPGRSGMTHLFGCHDNVLPSAECCSEQPCCLAAVGWRYSTKIK